MKKKDRFITIALVLVLVTGLSLLLYPTVSNWWNTRVSSHAVNDYMAHVGVIDNEEYDRMLEEARAYNESLLDRQNGFTLSDDQRVKYDELLDISGGIMGYIEIPAIQVELPIYHGTSEPVLQIAVGHLEWTSLPVGGESTHVALSGHRGLPSAKLFTDLDKLVVGDIYVIHVLDEKITYEVDQIKIVEPHNSEDLLIEEGKDLVTLVTCTPYGVNSHRLLVRGHRIENLAEAQVVRITADAVIVEKLIVAPFLLVPILLVVLLVIAIPNRKKRRDEK